MRFTDSEWVPSTPEETWKALHDPAVLQTCIPGCERVEQLSDTEYAITLSARVVGARHRFVGELLLSDQVAPFRCQVAFEGTEEQAGLAIGHASVNLQAASHGGTHLQYELQAAAGGALAQLGEGPLEHVCRKMVDDFFTHFVDYMGSHAQAYETSIQAAGNGSLSGSRGPGNTLSWLMVAGTIVLIALYYMFLR